MEKIGFKHYSAVLILSISSRLPLLCYKTFLYLIFSLGIKESVILEGLKKRNEKEILPGNFKYFLCSGRTASIRYIVEDCFEIII